MADESRNDDLKSKSPRERLYEVSRYLVKVVPGVFASGPVSALTNEIFDLLVSDPSVKRRDRFMQDMALRIANLEDRHGLSLNDLHDNEEVAAILLRATQAAMRSSGQEKLRALAETAEKGIVSAVAKKAQPAQVVIGVLDRLTEHHILLLVWENRKLRRGHTLGELKDENNETARRSLFYGQPVYADPAQLVDPVLQFNQSSVALYVERHEKMAFQLARLDLIALGLMEPVLKTERFVERGTAKTRTTPEVASHRISNFGRFVCDYITKSADTASEATC